MYDDIGVGITIKMKGMKEAFSGLSALEGKANDLDGRDIKIGMEGVKNNAKQTNGFFSGMISIAKKLAFALLTVRGVWFAIRKSMTMYLSQNEELQARLNGIYYAMGSLFAPVLEGLIRILATILWFVNQILIALGFAGINMKNFGKATGSAAKQMKQLLGFDEINNLTTKQSGGSGSTKIKNPFEDILRAKFLKDNLWEILAIVLAIGTALAAWKMGLSPEKILGFAIVMAGIALLIGSVLDYLNDPSWENFGSILTSLGVIAAGLGIAFGSMGLVIAGIVLMILGSLAGAWESISAWFQGIIQWMNDVMNKAFEINPLLGVLVGTILGILQEMVRAIHDLLDGIFKGVKDILDGIIQILKGDFTGGMDKVMDGLLEIIIGGLNFIIDALNGILSPVRAIITGVGQVLGKDWTMDDVRIPNIKLSSFDVGTNYVPNDMIAQVHRGEAIVPKEFNPSAFYGNSTAEELNLLASINEQLIELNAKDIDINLDGENVATTINNHIQNINERNGQRVFALGR